MRFSGVQCVMCMRVIGSCYATKSLKWSVICKIKGLFLLKLLADSFDKELEPAIYKIILGNFLGLAVDVAEEITSNYSYIIYEHDHKYP